MINIKNSYNTNISFKQLPFTKYYGKKIAKEYTVPIKINDGCDAFVKIEPDYVHNNFETRIQDINEENIATNYFTFIDNNKTILNSEMNVWYRCNRGKNFGVIMHLNNIIELLENDFDKIELYSLAPAVLFHGKCKFEPKLTDFKESMNSLYTITTKDVDKYPELKPIVKNASELLEKMHNSEMFMQKHEKLIAKANKVVSDYIELFSSKKLSENERQEIAFDIGFNMELTKERIIENKDYFNKLFKKFNIDYSID